MPCTTLHANSNIAYLPEGLVQNARFAFRSSVIETNLPTITKPNIVKLNFSGIGEGQCSQCICSVTPVTGKQGNSHRPTPANPPTHIRKMFLRKRRNLLKGPEIEGQS